MRKMSAFYSKINLFLIHHKNISSSIPHKSANKSLPEIPIAIEHTSHTNFHIFYNLRLFNKCGKKLITHLHSYQQSQESRKFILNLKIVYHNPFLQQRNNILWYTLFLQKV
jgi:hypothetical protein